MSGLFNFAPREVLPFDGSAVLIESFIQQDTADILFTDLMTEIPWQSHQLVIFGKRIDEPRLSAWIADEGVAYTYSKIERQPFPWTPTVEKVRDEASHATGSRFNSVLANLYRNGQDAMGWHSDDEPCNGPEPVIASVNFGASRRFDFRHKITKQKISVTLPHGSLLVMSGLSQDRWQHQIARTARVFEPRINLTFRNVLT